MKNDISSIRKLLSNNPTTIEEGFREIYERYHNLVFYLSYQISKKKEIAEEVANDVFLILYNHRNSLQEGKNLKYYITTITKNETYHRIQKESYVIDSTIINRMDEKEEDHFDVLLSEYSKILNQEELDILIRHILVEESFKKIAEDYCVSIFSISGKYKRAIDKLRKYYKEVEDHVKY